MMTIFCLPFIVKAQLNEGGKPVSLTAKLTTPIPETTMPPANISQLLSEEDEKGSSPYRFAVPLETELSLSNSGIWNTLDNGDRIWQLKITSQDALGILLLYNDFYLPPGATFFVYSPNYEQILGAFTPRNNKVDGKFATGLINGASVIIEYLEPLAQQGKGRISVEKVNHVYRDLFPKSVGESDICNININCPIGNPWASQQDAVVRMMVDGFAFCTGSLINNVRQDGKLYFLTANHCIPQMDAVTNPVASQFMFNWNYESPDCNNLTSAPSLLLTAGATLKANWVDSDFALFELVESPVENPAIDFFFAGWNKAATLPEGASTGIHHPNGDIKKICVDNETALSTPSDVGPLPPDFGWRVSWNTGITASGSSGSPLFDVNKRIIGQLWGGSSFCETPEAPDFYGKIAASWEGGGIAQRRSKDWLDPDNTGVMTLDGTASSGTCPFLQHITTLTNGQNDYKASATIEANNTIERGQNISYEAGMSITLQPGFHAQNNSVFSATIEDCTTDNTPEYPANDTCANPVEITSLPFCDIYTTVGATTSPELPAFSCLEPEAVKDVWFTVSVPDNGNLFIETVQDEGTLSDVIVQAYTGNCIELIPLDCNNHIDIDSLNSRINLENLTPNTIIYLRVTAFSGEEGGFKISIESPPSNDACVNAIDLPVTPTCTSTTYSNISATTSSELPSFSCTNPGLSKDIWFTATIPASGNLVVETIQIEGGLNDLVIQAYTGTCGELVELDCNDDIDFENANYHARITLVSQIPNSIIYFRVISYLSISEGFFGICAYDQVTSSLDKDTSEEFLAKARTTKSLTNPNLISTSKQSIDLASISLKVSPNPFAHTTNIQFYLPTASRANLMVLDFNGQLISEQKLDTSQGWNRAELEGNQLPAGVYYLTLQTAENRLTEKIMVIK